jgi:seryl-tRNA synthetase
VSYSCEIGLEEPAPLFLLQEILSKLAYVDERVLRASLSTSGDRVTLVLRERPEMDLERDLAKRVNDLVKAMAVGAFEPKIKVLESHYNPISDMPDPTPELLARGELYQEGPGYYAIGPMLSDVIDHIESKLLQVAQELGATRYRFPSLISPEYMERVQYFRNFPHSLSFASHLRGNLLDIQRFSCEATTRDGHIEVDPSLLAPPSAMLAPTVCHHLYMTLCERSLPPKGIVATACGNCFRYEARNMISLERTWNFTMREIIFVGSAEQVKRGLDRARACIKPILFDMGLNYRVITANDPFFVDTFKDQAGYQTAFELKHEIRADLPYKKETIAIGSYNRHRDFFGSKLNIMLDDGGPAHTGCIGIGLERLAYAFVSQHGLNRSLWPRALRSAIGND